MFSFLVCWLFLCLALLVVPEIFGSAGFAELCLLLSGLMIIAVVLLLAQLANLHLPLWLSAEMVSHPLELCLAS